MRDMSKTFDHQTGKHVIYSNLKLHTTKEGPVKRIHQRKLPLGFKSFDTSSTSFSFPCHILLCLVHEGNSYSLVSHEYGTWRLQMFFSLLWNETKKKKKKKIDRYYENSSYSHKYIWIFPSLKRVELPDFADRASL